MSAWDSVQNGAKFSKRRSFKYITKINNFKLNQIRPKADVVTINWPLNSVFHLYHWTRKMRTSEASFRLKRNFKVEQEEQFFFVFHSFFFIFKKKKETSTRLSAKTPNGNHSQRWNCLFTMNYKSLTTPLNKHFECTQTLIVPANTVIRSTRSASAT